MKAVGPDHSSRILQNAQILTNRTDLRRLKRGQETFYQLVQTGILLKIDDAPSLGGDFCIKQLPLPPILQPQKKFGQNFLVSSVMQRKIAARMELVVAKYPLASIVEIGPGPGALTQHFLTFQRPIVAIEIDPRAVDLLRQRFGPVSNLRLIQGDALELLTADPAGIMSRLNSPKSPNSQQLPASATFILLSNLPFNVGSRILVELPTHYPNVPFAVIVQREVANKTKLGADFTFFGAWLNLFWDLTVEFQIAPGNFYPIPKVYSSLLVGWPRQLPEWLDTVGKRIWAKGLLKTLFRQPRKTILNNLKNTEFASLSNQLAANQRLNWENYRAILSTSYDLQYRS